MQDIPVKFAGTAAATLASGITSIVSEHTLIPLGVFVVCSGALVTAAWKVATAVTKATGRLESVERRVKIIEDQIKQQ